MAMRHRPFQSKPSASLGIAAALVLGVIACWCISWLDATEALKAPSWTGQAMEIGAAAACAVDSRCAAEQALAVAGPACSQAIAQLAAYGVRWTSGDGAGRYARRDWRTDRPGTIRYGGDTAEFEDGAGHYRGIRYECDFDPVQGTVIDARAWPA